MKIVILRVIERNYLEKGLFYINVAFNNNVSN